jgi:3-deoxy-D-manno-octulosonic-acid transferase
MVLAPRHPERFEHVAALTRELKLPLVQRSSWDGAPVARGSVFLLDTIGELGSIYGLAKLAFVGGSLVVAGGHNPLEPARFAVPVIMGPHYANFREVVELLRIANALRVVERREVAEVLASLLDDTNAATAMGAQGAAIFRQQTGATGRVVEAVLQLLAGGGA